MRLLKRRKIGLANANVIIVGLGGAGTSIARRIAFDGPQDLNLVDTLPKQSLAADLSELCSTRYSKSIPMSDGFTILINATGKDESAFEELGFIELFSFSTQPGIYIDLSATPPFPFVALARQLGWQAFGGGELNITNDFGLLRLLSRYTETPIPDFVHFEKLVVAASSEINRDCLQAKS